MLVAITRGVSPRINDCELLCHEREPIDLAKAISQHQQYEACLAGLGANVISLPSDPELPDCVFVEDTAVVVDELAVILRMGAQSRRREVDRVEAALSEFRPVRRLTEPATIDGGDVMQIGRTLFVGASKRTNEGGIRQLEEEVAAFGYRVGRVDVYGCLHLKSGCSYISRNSILVNRSWVDTTRLGDYELIDVSADEPSAANALLVSEVIVFPASFPRTAEILEGRGFRVREIDVSEFQKAEGGVTCKSLIFEYEPR